MLYDHVKSSSSDYMHFFSLQENPEPMQEISKATPSKENSNPLSRQLNSVRIGVTQESPLLLSAQERTVSISSKSSFSECLLFPAEAGLHL